jgi:hypothetical protein
MFANLSWGDISWSAGVASLLDVGEYVGSPFFGASSPAALAASSGAPSPASTELKISSRTSETIQEVVNLHASLLQEHTRAFSMMKSHVHALLAESAAAQCGNICNGCGVSIQEPSSQSQLDEFPWITVLVVSFGCLSILLFGFKEWKFFHTAKAIEVVDREHYWKSLAEFLQYRLDFHLSVSSMSKPLFLLILSFIIILVSAVSLMIFTGEDFSASFWTAWTYVADSGTPKFYSSENHGFVSSLLCLKQEVTVARAGH